MAAPLTAYNQQSHTIHWMKGVPQASYFNPALIPEAELYIGLPGLSSHYSGLSHSGFAYNDLLRKDPAGSFYWDEDHMLGSLNNHNLLEGVMQHELLTVGIRLKNNFFSFSASENLLATFSYPRDLMILLVKGNDHFRQQQQVADLSGIGLDASHYRQLAFGFAHDWDQVFSLGLRAKMLFGMANVSFEKSHLLMDTHLQRYDVAVDADIIMNTSLPVSFIPLDSNGSGQNADFGSWDYLGNQQNFGFALDMGLSWKPVHELILAASVIDLGHIDWRSGVENFAVKGDYAFRGISLQELFEEEDPFANTLDSITDIFNVEETTLGYRTTLPTKINLSAGYDLNARHHLGALIRGTIYHGQVYPAYTLSYNYNPMKMLGFSLAWSVINNTFINLGAGMKVDMGPVQFYLAGDNFLGMMQPHAAQATNVHLGFNLIFGNTFKEETAQPL